MSFRETEFGLILGMWEICELKDKVEITMGQSPKSEFYNSDENGTPFMQGRTTFGEKYHSIDTWCTAPKKYAKKNDVLMSVRAPVGDVNIAKMDLCIGRGLASLRMKNRNNEFLYYLLKNYVDIIVSRESGTVFGSINKLGIESLKLPFPHDKEQKVIAHILTTLDDKIEINNQINKKLEEMAQAIFKQWFVDFEFPNDDGEPYKSSGGEMVESEMGMIPKGWKYKDLGNLCNITSSKRIFMNEYVQEGIPFYRGKEIIEKSKGALVSTGLYISIDKYNDIKEKFSVPVKGDILLTSVGTLGVPYKVDDENFYFKDGNLTWFKDYIKNEYSNYIYLWLLADEGQKSLESITIGSTQKALTIASLKKLKLITPNDLVLKKFELVISKLIDKIYFNNNEKENLIKVRDILLPKLMSGEIRVPLE